MTELPPVAARLTYQLGAWVVGSAADPAAVLAQLRDIDIAVPFPLWEQAACVIPASAVPNTFGGWKFDDAGVEVDVWPDDVADRMLRAKSRFAWHPKSGVRLERFSE